MSMCCSGMSSVGITAAAAAAKVFRLISRSPLEEIICSGTSRAVGWRVLRNVLQLLQCMHERGKGAMSRRANSSVWPLLLPALCLPWQCASEPLGRQVCGGGGEARHAATSGGRESGLLVQGRMGLGEGA